MNRNVGWIKLWADLGIKNRRCANAHPGAPDCDQRFPLADAR